MLVTGELRKQVLEHIPGFDFDKERTRLEIRSLWKVIHGLQDKKATSIRKEAAVEAGAGPGIAMVSLDGHEEEIVKSISKSGYLIFHNRKGAFNPRFWKIKEE